MPGRMWFPVVICLVLTACATQTEASAPTAAPTITPAPTLDPRDVLTGWRDIDSLARTHMLLAEKNIVCASCHENAQSSTDTATGEATFQDPSDATCLSCHEGSVPRLIAKTNTGGIEIHPPTAHLGDIACAFCHAGHAAFTSPCKYCH